MAKQAVAKTGAEQAALPAHLQQGMDQYAGMGNSSSAQDNTLPFLAIAQQNSPQLDNKAPEFIEGAAFGDLFNTATSVFWKSDEGLDVIPFAFQKALVEWVPRASGGGYVATYPADHEIRRQAKPWVDPSTGKSRGLTLPSGNDLVETSYTFVFVPAIMSPMVIGAASTALKPMRDWMALRNSFRIGGKIAPSFARVYRARTVYQTNDAGKWYNWKFGDGGWLEDAELFSELGKLALQAERGEMVVGRPPEAVAAGAEGGDDSIPV